MGICCENLFPHGNDKNNIDRIIKINIQKYLINLNWNIILLGISFVINGGNLIKTIISHSKQYKLIVFLILFKP